ncbi:MAG: hypothetical protein IJL38_00545 [Bacteroidales bacterium]|nr:hypothetical protein [Bacteroidales bacterium]
MTKKILIIDDVHPVMVERLREAGLEVCVNPGMSRRELLKAVGEYDGLVVRSKIEVDREVLDAAGKLHCVGRVGAGMETIDVEYAEGKGIRCLNSPEGNRDAVGEHAVGLLLALLNNIARADSEVRGGLWQREANRGVELQGKTVGIVGYGNMGAAFARRLQGFGCRVAAYDKYKKGFGSEYVEEVTLEQLYEESDVVSLHVPLTDETRYMVDRRFLERFSKPIYLLNTSRGAVVKTVDLVKAMESGSVTGAALDVLEYENMTADAMGGEHEPEALTYLKKSPRVVLTPHVAGWTAESKVKLAAVLAEKIKEVICS